ncbi:ATP-binding protein [Streptomyces sp. NPDC048179]|uniref:ATP-binding protein n=1 Tax=Streptomyces sp. NPDC048179 TaxID=3365506 RepID=UPI003720B26D
MTADLLDAPQAMADGTGAATHSRPGVLEIELQLTAASVTHVREIVVAHLALWGLIACEWQVGLATSELLTNAFKHARPANHPAVHVRLVLSRTPGGLFLAVTDPDRRHPTSTEAGDEDEGGRGIPLLRQIAEGFGFSSNDRGKDVWITFATP